MTDVILKALAVWVLFVVLAILNGTLREKLLVPLLGKQLAQPLSGILLSGVIFVVTILVFPLLGLTDSSQCFLVGGLWLLLTVAFEFLFGHFVAGESWTKLLEAYNIFSGNLWILVLITTALAPYLAGKIRGVI
jgi:hypothetical protein